jgi:hypothetical protein
MPRSQYKVSRRGVLAGSLASFGLVTFAGHVQGQTPISRESQAFGILAGTGDLTDSVALIDPATGDVLYRYDAGPRPNAAWATPVPGLALVRCERSLAIVDLTDGSMRPIDVPETVAPNLSPAGIQFRGSAGYEQILIGTPNSDANTFLVDLLTGERRSVVGMLGAEKPPVSLQNVAVASDDRHLLAWDGRTTWIAELTSGVSRVLGSGQFTFSAEFSADGSQLVYSQQMADKSTQLLLQDLATQTERVIGQSATGILVSLWITSRGLLLLDERTADGGTLAVYDPATANREDILSYSGATNIVQFTPDGQQSLIGIEGGQGRDWYQLTLSLHQPASQLLPDLTDAVVSPGFDFAAGWALALPPTATATGSVAVKAVDLATGVATPLITGITSDAELSGEVVAPSGNAALLTIDSFTELAVHYLRLDEPVDIGIDLITPGPSVIAPDGSGFAVSQNDMTAVYDESGAEGATFPGNVLAWV